MTLGDRIRRWWSPAKWRDEHPEVSSGEGFALGREDQRIDHLPKLRRFGGRDNARYGGRYGRR